MQLRYMGFSHKKNVRLYKFDGIAQGQDPEHFIVTADLVLFLKHHVGIQEGPSLCLRRLSADIEGCHRVNHELTDDDLLAYVTARTAAQERKSNHGSRGRHHAAASAASAVPA